MPRYDVVLKPSAVRDLDRLRKYDATAVAGAMETHLGDAPTKLSRSRIKQLRGIRDPDYRLRVGEFRVFYTVDEEASQVVVLRVMHKDETRTYYEELSE